MRAVEHELPPLHYSLRLCAVVEDEGCTVAAGHSRAYWIWVSISNRRVWRNTKVGNGQHELIRCIYHGEVYLVDCNGGRSS